jgi:site-specific DNA recombinase
MRSDAAACYCRSSKDRSDISPATQLAALEQLATSRSLVIVETFEDAVESGSTEDRPGFQRLIRAIKDPRRTWSTLLVYDTSRIARRRYIAQAFKHDLKKRGISLMYATRPADIDPISEVVLDSMLEAMDEVHSMMSREKGLAGMAENVRQGWRAGGRPPTGYQLEHVPTGAVRDGREVTKSRLVPSDLASEVRAYLKARAGGMPRTKAVRASGLTLLVSSCVDLEWNALTYAGHTVWNMRHESGAGTKRRPREQWVIRRETHQALISDSEAERILVMLEHSNMSAMKRVARAAGSRFLLSGLVYSTDGRCWEGNGPHYRLRKAGELAGRAVKSEVLEQAVIDTLREFRSTDAYLQWLLAQTRKAPRSQCPGGDLQQQIRKLERERARAAEAAVEGETAGVYRDVVATKTRQIDALRRELAAVEREAVADDGFQGLTLEDVRGLVESQDPAQVVRTLVDRVVLEPDLACQIQVKRQASYNGLWADMASPRRPRPHPEGLVLDVGPWLRRLAG